MERWFERWFDEDYHRLYAHRDGREAERAVETVLALAPELAQGPVLDLGCGAGRHLEVLRRANPEAFGLDLSRALLREAPAPLRPWLLRADMRHLPVRPGSLAGACLWFTAFGYFDDGANAALLHHLTACLRPGGLLVLDYLNAPAVRAGLVPEDVCVQDGLRITSRRSLEGRRLVKRMRLERLGSGEAREVAESVRLYEPVELEALATGCGLHPLHQLGDYDGAPWGWDSPRYIGLFGKS